MSPSVQAEVFEDRDGGVLASRWPEEIDDHSTITL
jgi:hypothetical protein